MVKIVARAISYYRLCSQSLGICRQYKCCCWYWPPVREVCHNYEVVEFQPWTLTTPDLGSIAYCYIAYLLDPPHPLLLPSDISPPPQSSFACLRHRHHRIIRPHGRFPSPSQHTENPSLSLLLPITSDFRFVRYWNFLDSKFLWGYELQV